MHESNPLSNILTYTFININTFKIKIEIGIKLLECIYQMVDLLFEVIKDEIIRPSDD